MKKNQQTQRNLKIFDLSVLLVLPLECGFRHELAMLQASVEVVFLVASFKINSFPRRIFILGHQSVPQHPYGLLESRLVFLGNILTGPNIFRLGFRHVVNQLTIGLQFDDSKRKKTKRKRKFEFSFVYGRARVIFTISGTLLSSSSILSRCR